VQRDRGFVLHRPGPWRWESTMEVSDTLHVTTSRDVLAAMAKGDGPCQAVVALGYAGWEAGQLDEELLQNAWLTVPCDDTLIFELPFEQRWHAAARLLGVELSRISTQAGRA
jgi:putative transcriptional regulator